MRATVVGSGRTLELRIAAGHENYHQRPRRDFPRGPVPFPCFTQYVTLADTLDLRHVGWQYYTSTQNGYSNADYLWSPFSAIESVRYGPDWSNVITPQTDVLKAAKKGVLKGVTWVVPSGPDSDHPGAATDRGPSWVASVVNAVGTGPQWSSSAMRRHPSGMKARLRCRRTRSSAGGTGATRPDDLDEGLS
ncbi:MAG TPA: alkaline phosphatase family protein [Candidatus Cybelea sp.]